MAFFELKPNDVITTTYTSYPSYNLFLSFSNGASIASSSAFYLFPSTSVKVSRTFTGINNEPITGSYQITGTVVMIGNSAVTNREKYVINRLRNIYASSSFKNMTNFITTSVWNQTTPSSQTMTFINIPAVLYGSKIKEGSFYMSYSVTGVDAIFKDDGYGGIYLSSGVLTKNEVVGSIYYEYGLVYFGHNSFITSPTDGFYVNFSGTNIVPMTMYLCKAPKSTANFSNNSSYVVQSGSASGSAAFAEITTEQPKTFITTVGLYDENYKLVGIAKVSSPILNDEQTSILARLKLNF